MRVAIMSFWKSQVLVKVSSTHLSGHSLSLHWSATSFSPSYNCGTQTFSGAHSLQNIFWRLWSLCFLYTNSTVHGETHQVCRMEISLDFPAKFAPHPADWPPVHHSLALRANVTVGLGSHAEQSLAVTCICIFLDGRASEMLHHFGFYLIQKKFLKFL